MRVHRARHKIVALHAILVRCAVSEMGEGCLAERVLFELPGVFKILADMEANWSIVVFPLDRAFHGLALRVTLNTNIIRLNIVQPGRIHDIDA